MSKHGKRYRGIAEKLTPDKQYSLEEAVDFIKANPAAKFDETLEMAIRLGVDYKKSEVA